MRLHPWPHAIAITGAVGFSISVVLLSRAVGWVTDTVIGPGLTEGGPGVSDRRLLAAFLVVMAVAVARGLGAIVRRYYLAMAEYKTVGTWRDQLFDQYMAQPLSFHRSIPTGRLLAHVDNDLTVSGIVLKPLAFAVATVVLAALAVVNLTLLHPWFGLIALVLLPILAVINRVYSNLVAHPASQVQQAVADVTSVAHESFDGVMVVKTLGRQGEEVDRMEVASADLRQKRLVVGRLRAVFEPLLEVLPNLGVVALLLVGAGLVDDGRLSVGDVIGAMTLFTVIGLPIRILGFFLQAMPPSVVALERIDDVLERPRPDEIEPKVWSLPDGALGLTFDNVRFAHGKHSVLTGVDLAVEPGETLALVGATGSGKTTMLELGAGLIEPAGGTVRLGGADLTELSPAVRAERLAMVFQETFLFAETIGENITLGEDVPEESVIEAARIAQAHRFVLDQPEGYGTLVGERGVTLSGGQRQRVALARALVRSPSILLLDDATSAVDPAIERSILDGLRSSVDVTLVIVAHRLSTIQLADRVAFLDDGRIVATGTHAELLRSVPDYERLVRAYETEAAGEGIGAL